MFVENPTLKSIWLSILQGVWYGAFGKSPWGRREIPRCDFCGRRLDRDSVSRALRSSPKVKATFITTCLKHGAYDGQVVMDCFTGGYRILSKEPMFYHETVIFDEARFYIASILNSVRWFFKSLPLNLLCSIEFVTKKAIERQKERLYYK
jgi:hypothetical protein